jgi:glycerophosphoryl diester phosphodiesterase
MSTRPLVLGHRGAPPLARENTVRSFLVAIEEGADGVELDVQVTSDGALVLHHDPLVDGVPAHHLRRADVAAALGGVDTLDEAFAALPASATVFVEVKRQTAWVEETLPERLVALARARGVATTIVGSFDPYLVRVVAELAPDVVTGLIVDRRGVGDAARWRPRADVVSMEHPLATGAFLDGVVGARTLAWPVDAAADLDACFARFPDLGGVITKHPRLARARWEARGV